MQVLTAWASSNRLVLGQQKVDPTSNEITAVPALLDKLALAGCIVTLDALHCQVETAKAIRRRQADYVLAAKGNQGTLHQAITDAFAAAQASGFSGLAHDHYETVETAHGRWERRTYWTLMDPDVLRQGDPKSRWPDLGCIGKVRAERQVNGETSVEERLFISSTDGSAETLGRRCAGTGGWRTASIGSLMWSGAKTTAGCWWARGRKISRYFAGSRSTSFGRTRTPRRA